MGKKSRRANRANRRYNLYQGDLMFVLPVLHIACGHTIAYSTRLKRNTKEERDHSAAIIQASIIPILPYACPYCGGETGENIPPQHLRLEITGTPFGIPIIAEKTDRAEDAYNGAKNTYEWLGQA